MPALLQLCDVYCFVSLGECPSAPIIAVYVNCVVPLARPHYVFHYNIHILIVMNLVAKRIDVCLD